MVAYLLIPIKRNVCCTVEIPWKISVFKISETRSILLLNLSFCSGVKDIVDVQSQRRGFIFHLVAQASQFFLSRGYFILIGIGLQPQPAQFDRFVKIFSCRGFMVLKWSFCSFSIFASWLSVKFKCSRAASRQGQ